MTTKKSKSKLIKIWKNNARFFKLVGAINKYSDYAQATIDRIEETKPNKEKNLLEQMNEEQKEFYEYMLKVKEKDKL